MGIYNGLTKEELSKELENLRELHSEVTEEREMVLYGTSGLHRSVAHQVEKYAKELGEIQEKINYIIEILQQIQET